jgi:hypothetical protein
VVGGRGMTVMVEGTTDAITEVESEEGGADATPELEAAD